MRNVSWGSAGASGEAGTFQTEGIVSLKALRQSEPDKGGRQQRLRREPGEGGRGVGTQSHPLGAKHSLAPLGQDDVPCGIPCSVGTPGPTPAPSRWHRRRHPSAALVLGACRVGPQASGAGIQRRGCLGLFAWTFQVLPTEKLPRGLRDWGLQVTPPRPQGLDLARFLCPSACGECPECFWPQ